jgi:hypothetical protein
MIHVHSQLPETAPKIDGTNESLMQTEVISKMQNILGDTFEDIITQQDVYLSSALYLIYWYHRTKNNPSKQSEMLGNISNYFGAQNLDEIKKLLDDTEIQQEAFSHVE